MNWPLAGRESVLAEISTVDPTIMSTERKARGVRNRKEKRYKSRENRKKKI